MRVLLWTDGDRARSAAAREWFYDMFELLRARGVDVQLNDLTGAPFDIAVVHWARLDRIRQVKTHSPGARIGVLNPGLGNHSDAAKTRAELDAQRILVANCSFFIASSLIWRDLLLSLGRRAYYIADWIPDLQGKPLKNHTADNNLVIGYHGNELHYAQDFFPNGARAIERLAREFRFTLKVVTSNVARQPRIAGVDTQFVEWTMDGIDAEMQSFDIGICPVFATFEQLSDPFTNIRNANRAISLLAYGIPSVMSPVFQAGHDLADGESTMFAVTEAGWYDGLKRLITDADLRNRMGRAGRAVVERRFSGEAVSAQYMAMLQEEMRFPALPATVPPEAPTAAGGWWQRWSTQRKTLRRDE